MALAMTIFGTISLFVKHIPLASGEIVLYRALLAIGVISLFLLARKQSIPFATIKKELPLLLLSGVGFLCCLFVLGQRRPGYWIS